MSLSFFMCSLIFPCFSLWIQITILHPRNPYFSYFTSRNPNFAIFHLLEPKLQNISPQNTRPQNDLSPAQASTSQGKTWPDSLWPLWIISWLVPSLQPDYPKIAQYCNLWRNYGDIQDTWDSLSSIVNWFGNDGTNFTGVAAPGAWNDPDMVGWNWLMGYMSRDRYKQHKRELQINHKHHTDSAFLAHPQLLHPNW